MGHNRKRPRPVSNENTVVETTTFDGRAIFCLHDNDDPGWIQGYFIPKGSSKPWGMLAVQEEVDDCMACCMGGYRRLTLTIYRRGQDNGIGDTGGGKKDTKRSNSSKISGVEWTGGDMIALYHSQSVDMQAEILLTGKKALPVLNKYFQGLIARLEKEFAIEDDSSVLDWLPNVAIVAGPMTLTIPMK